jgi:hypothetical protein
MQWVKTFELFGEEIIRPSKSREIVPLNFNL